MTDSAAIVRFLSQSEHRPAVLRIVHSEQQCDRDTIVAQVDATRRTTIRTIDALLDRWYLAKRAEGYQVTPLGSAVLRAYDDVVSELAVADRLAPFLGQMPPEWFNVDLGVLAEAEVVTAAEDGSYVLVERLLSLRSDAEWLQHVSPIIEQQSLAQLTDRLEAGRAPSGEIVISTDAWNTVQEQPRYKAASTRLGATDQLSLCVYPEQVPFMLCITEGAVAVGVTSGGRPHAQIVSEHPKLRGWATETFSAIRDRAVPVMEY